MAAKVNLNADIAEGWGAYDIGNDAAMMDIVKSANVACGMHAGDANTMHRLVMLARERGVSIGAHPGFNDLWGFGRRQIRMSATELEYLVAYQIGALQAMAAYGGLKVTHLKPHGALSNMACVEPDYAMAIARAIQTVDRDIIFVVLFGSEMEKAAQKLELRIAREGFCDRVYADDGQLASRALPGTVLKDPVEGDRAGRPLRARRRGRLDIGKGHQGAHRYAVRSRRRGDGRRGRARLCAAASRRRASRSCRLPEMDLAR